MINVRDESTEVTKADPCSICGKPDWCMHLKDGSYICGRVDIPPDGWIKSKAKSKDDRNIFHPKRNNATPRMQRKRLSWKDRSSDAETGERELEIRFPYSDTQRVVRRQWTDRREAYESKKTGKISNKLVLPQYWSNDEDKWKWGKGPDPWPLYRKDEILPSDVVFYVGGEKCVEALRRFGFSATCHQGGEGSYVEAIAEELATLKFLMLVIIPDNDSHGWKAAQKLLAETVKVGVPTSILDPKILNPDADDKWDIADWDPGISVAQRSISDAVRDLEPIVRTPLDDESSLDAIEAEVREIIKIRRPALRIMREKQLMKDFNLKSTELKELKGYCSRHGTSSSSMPGALFSEILEDAELVSRGEKDSGLSTGFTDLDAIIGGLEKERLITVGADPGMGKSTLALNIAINVAAQGRKAVYFSFEMSAKELSRRIISSAISVESQRLKRGALEASEWENLLAVESYLESLPLVISNPVPANLASIEAEIENHPDVELIIIDYLQLMHGPGSNTLEKLEILTGDIKLNALHKKVPIILLSQLNRTKAIRSNKRPQKSDLRGSGSIEQDSDILIFIYREEVYDPGTTERGVAEIIIDKNRDGPTGTVKLLFEGRFTRFVNLRTI